MRHTILFDHTAATPASVRDGAGRWRFELRAVSPSAAEEILKSNHENRRLRRGVVERYSRIMQDGDWRLTPEPIMVAPNGRLLNGQHRLAAIIKSQVTVWLLFALDVDEAVFAALDRGAPRTAADALREDRKLLEIARTCLLIARPELIGNIITDGEILRTLNVVRDAAERVQSITRAKRKYFNTSGFRAAAAIHILRGRNVDYALETYAALSQGRLADLWPMGHAAASAALRGGLPEASGARGQVNWAVIGWKVLDYDLRNNTRLVKTNYAPIKGEMREVLRRAGVECSRT